MGLTGSILFRGERMTETTMPRSIAALADAIHRTQAEIGHVDAELGEAESIRGRIGNLLTLAHAQGAAHEERMHQTAYDESVAKMQALKDRRRALEVRLLEDHQHLADAHRTRRIARALGRALRLASPSPPPQDPDLARWAASERGLRQQLADVARTLPDVEAGTEPAEARVRTLRVQVLGGKATAKDLASAQAAAERIADRRAQLTADRDALQDALRQVQTDRAAHEAMRHAARIPELQAQYTNRLRAFRDALRAAVIASEDLWTIYPELAGVTAVPLAPWPELRVVIDGSQALAWLLEAADVLDGPEGAIR
jgi:hypothetical protein